ncbi:AraC family transcriptional regulator [Cognatiyoonia sp. IB215182]|uniref:AraC family transcriptional regulator n=1 Tax=Cognatiyoonia sp. IB215182 TaxID=3097353 RepID=UPI002A0D6530|nr:AraC family transcriptional regulator [Cognatiyoonia sp. IB215182]MDX8355088.1 AraC family transcriptional regulator [Cognatiyoonia sp. IB215182]
MPLVQNRVVNVAGHKEMSILNKLIWQVEMRLHQPVGLRDLAQVCAVSPYHMARSFQIAAGLSPMAYLRARRLSVAAGYLARGDQDVLSIALDAQYNSHAAFTRAFVAYFGVTPQSVRHARSVHNLTLMEPLKMQKEMIVDVPPPVTKTRPAFRVIGLGKQASFDDNAALATLWQQFNAREDEIGDIIGDCAYGVCCAAGEQGHFRYVAGVAAPSDAGIPAGMEEIALPDGKYAVFTHKGHIADFPKTVYTIWNKALPDAGLEPRPAPEFELYDKRFDVETGRGEVEVWIPIQ